MMLTSDRLVKCIKGHSSTDHSAVIDNLIMYHLLSSI